MGPLFVSHPFSVDVYGVAQAATICRCSFNAKVDQSQKVLLFINVHIINNLFSIGTVALMLAQFWLVEFVASAVAVGAQVTALAIFELYLTSLLMGKTIVDSFFIFDSVHMNIIYTLIIIQFILLIGSHCLGQRNSTQTSQFLCLHSSVCLVSFVGFDVPTLW